MPHTSSGRVCERSFFDTFVGDYPRPYWLVSVKRAPPLLDVRGVDAIAEVKYPANGGIVQVPIQIKGAQEKVHEYYDLHPDARQARVVVLVIKKHENPARVRNLLYEHLIGLRDFNIRFDEYLKKLQETPVTREIEGILNKIMQTRAAEKHYASAES